MKIVRTLFLVGLFTLPFASAQPITAFYFTGSPESFISAGATRTLTPASGYSFTPSVGTTGPNALPSSVTFQINNVPSAQFWSVALGAPSGQTLATGEYLNATRFGFTAAGIPGLDFSGNGAGNNTLTGKFTILEITVSGGQLVSFAADFTQYDGGAEASWNYGSIRYNSSIPLNTLPVPPVQPLSVACTDADGPVVVATVYSYASTCLAAGGVGPYTWAIVNGQLPAGLTMQTPSPAGTGSVTISGKVTAAGPFSYTVQVTDSQSQAASQVFSGTTASAGCVPQGTFRTGSQSLVVGSLGNQYGYLGFRFISAGCPWTLTSDMPGLMLTPASGVTQGFNNTINAFYTVPPNPDPAPRQGNIFLSEGGVVVQTYPILVNSNSCSYTVNPTTAHVGAQGGDGNFVITPNPPNCYPFLLPQNSNPVSLTLDGDTYYYRIPPNTGAPRTGILQFGSDTNGTPSATLTWDQDGGATSLVMGCYPAGPARVGLTILNCSAAGGTPPYFWSIADGFLPGGPLLITSGATVGVGKAAVAGPYHFTVKVTDSSTPTANATTYTADGTILAAPPQITCSSAVGPVWSGKPYGVVCAGALGTPPYQWALASGALPVGLTMIPMDGGAVSVTGIPTSIGNYSYTLQLTDSTAGAAMSAVQEFSGVLNATDSPSTELGIACGSPPANLEIGVPATPFACSAFDGNPPYTWSFQTGELPPGMALSSSTGNSITIGGTPTATDLSGHFSAYLKVTDSSPTRQSRLWELSLNVVAQPSFTCFPSSGQVGQFYSASCTALGNATVISGILPPGLQLGPSSIFGTPATPGIYPFTISVQDNFVTVSQNYTIEIDPLPAPLNTANLVGAMAQIASGAGWESTTVLVNPESQYARAHVGYFANDGSAYSIPLLVTPGGTTTTSAAVDQIMAAHSRLTLDSQAVTDPQERDGWAALSADAGVDGFTRFHYVPWDQEALVPLETHQAPAYTLAFDNTNGIATGVAVANLTNTAISIPVVVRNDAGNRILSDTLSLPAMGHASFLLGDRFASTAGQSGTIEFDTPQNGRISVLGIRSPSAGRLTTIPVISGAASTTGAFAHLAVGGGWESTIELISASQTPANAHLKFFDDSGNPLSLPLNVAGTATSNSALDQMLAPYQHVVVDSYAPDGPAVVGSAQLTTDGSISGFIRFRYDPTGQEAIVPLETRNAAAYILAFEDVNGFATGAALSNLASQQANVAIVIRDSIGNVIGSDQILLPANGHTAFMLSDRFLPTVNQIGTIEFDAPAGGSISVLGLHANPSGAVSTIPVVTP